jgi:cytoskeletal protein RodZ
MDTLPAPDLTQAILAKVAVTPQGEDTPSETSKPASLGRRKKKFLPFAAAAAVVVILLAALPQVFPSAEQSDTTMRIAQEQTETTEATTEDKEESAEAAAPETAPTAEGQSSAVSSSSSSSSASAETASPTEAAAPETTPTEEGPSSAVSSSSSGSSASAETASPTEGVPEEDGSLPLTQDQARARLAEHLGQPEEALVPQGTDREDGNWVFVLRSGDKKATYSVSSETGEISELYNGN